jgi:hypothetical protein
VWGYSGTDREWVWVVLKTAEQLQFQLQYCVGIQRYWQTGGLFCNENSWTIKFTVTILCGDKAVLTYSGLGLYWEQMNSKIYSYSIVWGYSGTDRQWVCFVLKTAKYLNLQLQYCVGIQLYWQTGVWFCTENSWTVKFTVTVLCGDTAVLTERRLILYWKELNS